MSRPQPVPETNGASDLKSIVDERPEIPRAANVVGIDGQGCVHYHSPRERTVWVINPDPSTPIASVCTHEQRVERIWDWIEHTRTCRGAWRELRYDRGGVFEAIAETIVEATDE